MTCYIHVVTSFVMYALEKEVTGRYYRPCTFYSFINQASQIVSQQSATMCASKQLAGTLKMIDADKEGEVCKKIVKRFQVRFP